MQPSSSSAQQDPGLLHPSHSQIACWRRALRQVCLRADPVCSQPARSSPSTPPLPSPLPAPVAGNVPQVDDAVVDVGHGKRPAGCGARGRVDGRVASAAGPGGAQLLSGILHAAQRLATGGRRTEGRSRLVVGVSFCSRVGFSRRSGGQRLSLRWIGRLKAPCRGRISSQYRLRQGHPALARNTATGPRRPSGAAIMEA